MGGIFPFLPERKEAKVLRQFYLLCNTSKTNRKIVNVFDNDDLILFKLEPI